jgi:hypothetical protein
METKNSGDIPESPFPTGCCPKCSSKETKQTNIYMCDDVNICEYTLKCKLCEEVLGHWAYGHWQY